MNRTVAGWAWVAGQAIVLGALILLPGRSDFATPTWVETVAAIFFFGGLAIVVVGALGLGTALTPTPVPARHGTLKTVGMYRFVRHPIYTGVLALVVGMALRSGSWIKVAIAVGAFVFFDRKARWEEHQLAERYPGYAEYAARTPRFVPQPWRA